MKCIVIQVHPFIYGSLPFDFFIWQSSQNIILHSAEKGTLRIETVRNADACVIRVICDDEINDAESLAHICEAFPLLKTVKERLAYFCEGSLEAVRRDSKTEIIITVPHLDEAETDSDVTASAAPDPV